MNIVILLGWLIGCLCHAHGVEVKPSADDTYILARMYELSQQHRQEVKVFNDFSILYYEYNDPLELSSMDFKQSHYEAYKIRGDLDCHRMMKSETKHKNYILLPHKPGEDMENKLKSLGSICKNDGQFENLVVGYISEQQSEPKIMNDDRLILLPVPTCDHKNTIPNGDMEKLKTFAKLFQDLVHEYREFSLLYYGNDITNVKKPAKNLFQEDDKEKHDDWVASTNYREHYELYHLKIIGCETIISKDIYYYTYNSPSLQHVNYIAKVAEVCKDKYNSFTVFFSFISPDCYLAFKKLQDLSSDKFKFVLLV